MKVYPFALLRKKEEQNRIFSRFQCKKFEKKQMKTSDMDFCFVLCHENELYSVNLEVDDFHYITVAFRFGGYFVSVMKMFSNCFFFFLAK